MKQNILSLLFSVVLLSAGAQTPVTPNASPEARALLNFLYAMKGKVVLAGQHGIDETEYVHKLTGRYPAIKGHDLIHEDRNGRQIQSAIDWWKQGGIPTVMWHWGAPGKGPGYENSKKQIDIDRCFKKGTAEHQAMWSDLKRIADWLTVLRDAHVPVLWRPLHECDGNWFWYGKGSGNQFCRLWRTMFDYFTHERGLNNLIWVLCHSGEPKSDFNPGPGYYDLAGADSYSEERTRKEMYDKVRTIHGDAAPIPYHECGTIPDPDQCHAVGADWSWWMLWSGEHCHNHDSELMKEVYANPRVMTLDRLPRIMDFLNPAAGQAATKSVPTVSEIRKPGYFPISDDTIYTDANDYKVVGIAANMLADDVERITGRRPLSATAASLKRIPKGASIAVGTVGKSRLIDELVRQKAIDVSAIKGKWESFVVTTIERPRQGGQMLVIAGSDRRGTAFGLTSLCEAIGVSPWYWWADVTPQHKETLFLEPCNFVQGEPSVQYRGIFINDERFGGWARWAEQNYEKESGKVGPKTYQKVFELLLRLKANYLWPAMHPGTQAFNDNPENAQLADDYAIVMGSSHCEQMLRNNEGEWKAVNQRAKERGEEGLGDFNYITNRQTMQNYWETRVKTNGRYENTYTLGLRGIHDYPMENANTTAERVALMQQAIDDQSDMLRRNIKKPLEEIPQVLCTYEEVLEAYHNGLKVPEDVTLLWSDDKHGYCRNLCNPDEMERKGGAGIYYHLSYHGDPASWIWLSPLSTAFLSTELSKAYTYGARKIWVFNVGDIKPAEKEISFVMDLAWDVNRWKPSEAHNYTKYWAAKTFGNEVAQEISDIQAGYYRLQAAGKDAHIWFVNYSEEQIEQRIAEWRALKAHATELSSRIPEALKNAYFELVSYPVCGAAMINEYQLLARRSMVRATACDSIGAMADANRVSQMFSSLNELTRHYNEDILDGKWQQFFNWQPYHWFRSEKIEQPVATPELIAQAANSPQARFLAVNEALSGGGAVIKSDADAEIPLWIEALTPIRNFSKEAKDNEFCQVETEHDSFLASATPINNVWHAPYVGPMWSRVGTIHLKRGDNHLRITNLKADARIDQLFLGLYPPFVKEPRLRIPASHYQNKQGGVERIEGLGYADGVMVQPFDTPSYQQENIKAAPCVEYELDLQPGDATIEIRTLPTLHVYDGRDIRYAVQLGDAAPTVFSIHANDFTAEWRWNVLRGYASRCVPLTASGRQHLRIYLLDPGVVLQEVLIHSSK